MPLKPIQEPSARVMRSENEPLGGRNANAFRQVTAPLSRNHPRTISNITQLTLLNSNGMGVMPPGWRFAAKVAWVTCAAVASAWALTACGPATGAGDQAVAATESAVIGLGTAVQTGAIARYGLNLGGPSAWGAEQLLANAVANPGFESVLDRSLVTIEAQGAGYWVRDVSWTTRAAGFWRGARGDVLTGVHAGTPFTVVDDLATPQENRAHLHLDQPLPQLRSGDVVSLQTQTTPLIPARWWGQGRISTVAGGPPGSLGGHVARLEPAPTGTTELASYMDTLERAGRMLPVSGPWELRFAARATGGKPAQLRVRLARDGGAVFVDQVLSPGAAWEWQRLAFTGRELARGKGTLSLSFTLVQGTLELDEVYLGEATPGAGGFRTAVVDTLRQLQPGYLRDWQGQLGDTAANRVAAGAARRPVRYRAGDAEVLHTHSVQQVVALSQAVGARPWLVLPTTFSASEAAQFGTELRRLMGAAHLDQVVVEFGNENWNPLFSSAGLVNAATHREAAQRAMAALRVGFGSQQPGGPELVTMVNARLGDGESLSAFGPLPAVDRVSVAPYFSYQFDSDTPLAQQLAQAFSPDQDAQLTTMASQATALNTRLSAYELNLHTTEGSASTVMRNALVAGAASGPALARRLLAGSLAGVGEQAVYALAGFDAFTANGELVRLFGITRDLATAGRLRPTGVALAMLNSVAGGTVYTANCQGPACSGLTAAAFAADPARWAVVNGHDGPRTLRLRGACAGTAPQLQLLDGSDPWLNNETDHLVQPVAIPPQCDRADLMLEMPAHSLLTVH